MSTASAVLRLLSKDFYRLFGITMSTASAVLRLIWQKNKLQLKLKDYNVYCFGGIEMLFVVKIIRFYYFCISSSCVYEAKKDNSD